MRKEHHTTGYVFYGKGGRSTTIRYVFMEREEGAAGLVGLDGMDE